MRRWLGRNLGGRPAAQNGHAEQPSDWAARQLEARGIRDPHVLAAMRAVPRERFVPPQLAAPAYEDGALPIGHGQTISQPYIVASHDPGAGTDRLVGRARRGAARCSTWARAPATRRPCWPRWARRSSRSSSSRSSPNTPALRSSALATRSRSWSATAAPAYLTRRRSPRSSSLPRRRTCPCRWSNSSRPDGRLVIPIGTRCEQVITLVRPTADGFVARAARAGRVRAARWASTASRMTAAILGRR